MYFFKTTDGPGPFTIVRVSTLAGNPVGFSQKSLIFPGWKYFPATIYFSILSVGYECRAENVFVRATREPCAHARLSSQDILRRTQQTLNLAKDSFDFQPQS